jgi:hypothetical protein
MSTDRSKDDTAQTGNVLFSLLEEAIAASRYQTADITVAPTTGKEGSGEREPLRTGEKMLTAQTGGIYPFRGQMYFTWRSLDAGVRFETIEYKIEKGNNSGGNNANVVAFVTGGSIASARTDKGIQDGQWHILATNLDVNWSSTITLLASFVFDKSWAGDPTASAVDSINP